MSMLALVSAERECRSQLDPEWGKYPWRYVVLDASVQGDVALITQVLEPSLLYYLHLSFLFYWVTFNWVFLHFLTIQDVNSILSSV